MNRYIYNLFITFQIFRIFGISSFKKTILPCKQINNNNFPQPEMWEIANEKLLCGSWVFVKQNSSHHENTENITENIKINLWATHPRLIDVITWSELNLAACKALYNIAHKCHCYSNFSGFLEHSENFLWMFPTVFKLSHGKNYDRLSFWKVRKLLKIDRSTQKAKISTCSANGFAYYF